MVVFLFGGDLNGIAVPLNRYAAVPRRKTPKIVEHSTVSSMLFPKTVTGISGGPSAEQVNLRRIQSANILDDNRVSLLIAGFGNGVPFGDPEQEIRSLRRELLHYNHRETSGYSYPVQRLYVSVADIPHLENARNGRIILKEKHLDRRRKYEHISQIIDPGIDERSDAALKSIVTKKIFFYSDHGDEVVVNGAKEEEIAYVRTDHPPRKIPTGVEFRKPGDRQYVYQQIIIEEDYERPDHSIFVRKTLRENRVWKPIPPLAAGGALFSAGTQRNFVALPVMSKRAAHSMVPLATARAPSGLGFIGTTAVIPKNPGRLQIGIDKVDGGNAHPRTIEEEKYTSPNDDVFIPKTFEEEENSKSPRPAPIPAPPMAVTIPVHHWNKPVLFRGGCWDYNVGLETVTVQPGAPVPRAIELNSDWSFNKYRY